MFLARQECCLNSSVGRAKDDTVQGLVTFVNGPVESKMTF